MNKNIYNFSVLMSVYKNDDHLYLKTALESIFENQIYKPNEIVIVKDGLLTIELDMVISKWQFKNKNLTNIKVIELLENKGLGKALSIGLEQCTNQLVARMDADDISLPNRFKEQYEYLILNTDVSLVGGYILEFLHEENSIEYIRKVPLKYSEIIKFAKKRNPINHVSVMFKKNDILKVGNYETMYGFEDYYLWIKLIQNGYKLENLPIQLLKVRLGDNFLSRRKGLKYAKYEYNFFKQLFLKKFINKKEFYKLIAIRIPLRFVPEKILKIIYKSLRQK